VLEHLGDEAGAIEHLTEAERLDPETFPSPLEIEDIEFDAMVEKSVRELPERVRQELEEVPVLVQPLPDRELLTGDHPPLPPDILGLFVGRHLMERSHNDPPAAPGAIYLFRKNLLRACADKEELAKEIRTTVQHEVGHLLGLDEDDLEEWGLA
jgi:predicted Zn-dependent protease with MMP-like domain